MIKISLNLPASMKLYQIVFIVSFNKGVDPIFLAIKHNRMLAIYNCLHWKYFTISFAKFFDVIDHEVETVKSNVREIFPVRRQIKRKNTVFTSFKIKRDADRHKLFHRIGV